MRPSGYGVYECDLRRPWWVIVGPNGGYLAAILARALEAEISDRPLRSLTIHYLRAPEAGPARVRVEIQRAGRSVTFAHARFEQDGEPFANSQAVLCADREGIELDGPPAPRVPPPEDLDALPDADEAPPFARNFDFRPALGAAPFSEAEEALTGGWLALREPRVLDGATLATLCDTWYPAIFATTAAPIAVPTLDLTLHLRARLPLPHEWVLGRYRTRSARHGLLDEDATLWSRQGELLAQSRQLALAL